MKSKSVLKKSRWHIFVLEISFMMILILIIFPKHSHAESNETEFRFIQEFLEDPDSSTGYSITTLIKGKLEKHEISKNVYDLQFDPQYVFPLITETPRVPVYDENGVMIELNKAKIGETIYAGYGFGVPKTIGHVIRAEDDRLIIKAKEFNEEMKNGLTVYYGSYRRGEAPLVGEEDLVLPLSKDVLIQCLDWTKNEEWHSVKDIEFMKDVLNNKKNCYWISIYDMYGEDLIYDCVNLFRHPKKDPNSKGGDLSLDTRDGEICRKELTQ